MQHGFYFAAELCVKCHACEIACKTWNEVDVGPRWREVVKVETGEFPDVQAMNVSMACRLGGGVFRIDISLIFIRAICNVLGWA